PSKTDSFGDRVAVGSLRLAMGEPVVHRRSLGIGNADHDVLLFSAEIARYAGEGSTGADRTDETIDLSLRLFPDFRSRRKVVGSPVVEIVPLIGKEDAVHFVLAQFLGDAPADVLIVVGISVGHRRNFHEL